MAELSSQPVATTVATPASRPYGSKALAWVMLIVAAVTTMYWLMWFLIPGGKDLLAVLPSDHGYLSFENAFPAADGWMALCGVCAGVLLLRGNSRAIPWLFMAGSAGMYLGGMDILYDLENGIYPLISQNPGSVVTEMTINVATVVISVVTLVWANNHRAWQGQGQA